MCGPTKGGGRGELEVDEFEEEEEEHDGDRAGMAGVGEMPSSSLISFSSITSRRLSLVMGMGPLRSYDSLDQVRNSSTGSSSKRTRTVRSSCSSRAGWCRSWKDGVSSKCCELWVELESELEERVSEEAEETEVERDLRQGLRGWLVVVLWKGWKRVSRECSSQHSDKLPSWGESSGGILEEHWRRGDARASMSASSRSRRSSVWAGVC